MNYRHAFHAGNFADVFKHALLCRVLFYLMQKDAPLRYLDTHAGAGLYDIAGEAANRTGEWKEGVGLVAGAEMPERVRELLAPWMTVAGIGESLPETYPGSPVIAQRLLREKDRLTLCELHEADARSLARAIARDRRVNIVRRDGYEALVAWAPPPERRGLALVDPPFEAPDEFPRLAKALETAWRKWATGVYMAWYPRKDLAAVERFYKQLVASGIRRMLAIEFDVATPVKDGRLSGNGLIVINPPFTLEGEARELLAWLAMRLARGRGANWRIDWLAGE